MKLYFFQYNLQINRLPHKYNEIHRSKLTYELTYPSEKLLKIREISENYNRHRI